MAKREKPKSPIAPVASLEDANGALAEIAEIDRAVEAINARLNEDVDSLKEAASDEIAPLVERKLALGGGLENFAQLHRTELFKSKKSRELDFGVIGFRKSTSLGLVKGACSTWKEVLGKLKELAFKEAVRIREDVDKEVMSTWPNERLDIVGVKRIEKDEFFYETKCERVEGA